MHWGGGRSDSGMLAMAVQISSDNSTEKSTRHASKACSAPQLASGNEAVAQNRKTCSAENPHAHFLGERDCNLALAAATFVTYTRQILALEQKHWQGNSSCQLTLEQINTAMRTREEGSSKVSRFPNGRLAFGKAIDTLQVHLLEKWARKITIHLHNEVSALLIIIIINNNKTEKGMAGKGTAYQTNVMSCILETPCW